MKETLDRALTAIYKHPPLRRSFSRAIAPTRLENLRERIVTVLQTKEYHEDELPAEEYPTWHLLLRPVAGSPIKEWTIFFTGDGTSTYYRTERLARHWLMIYANHAPYADDE